MDVLERVQRSNGSRPAGCGSALDQVFWPLCATWGAVVQAVAGLGLVSCVVLMLVLLLWACCTSCRQSSALAALLLFLLATAGLFALPYSFIISLSPQTCPARVFAFGVLFSVAFGALLARGLALLGAALARGWREVCVTAVLALVQVIIAAEWLLVVLVQDKRTCQVSQPEFAMLQIYVLVLLAGALMLALRFLRRSCVTYSYIHSGRTHRRNKLKAGLLVLTLLLSACVWLVWITLLTYGNRVMGRSPGWDDPVISVALTANGWVLLLGHGFTRVFFMCKSEARAKDPPLDFTGWTSPRTQPVAPTAPVAPAAPVVPAAPAAPMAPMAPVAPVAPATPAAPMAPVAPVAPATPATPAAPAAPAAPADPKTGSDNSGFQTDVDGRRGQGVASSGIFMSELSAGRDYSIPRPTTTNINEPYDDYYGPRA